ncbi:MAG: protein-glutamate O-methyltransferase CheR [Porphyrobacter sp.]|nr:protein-glutamate O-methyltransferase CheR [Porphyrobacter sp.]
MTDHSQNALGIVAGLLEARTGQKLTADRLWRVGTALSGVLRQNELESLEDLVQRLGKPNQGALAQKVVEALLNNETYFFRDRAMFDQLSNTVLPMLAKRREASKRLSIWSVGCSTGQEAYSVAMLFAELPARWRGWTIEILGTDVARSVVEAAREANFSQFQIQRGLGVAQMVSFFEESRTGWRAKESLRNMVRFETHNLLDTPPEPGRFDLILCRNVLLYFDRTTRERAFVRLSTALAPDGLLMLGAGETTVGQTAVLVPETSGSGFHRLAVGAPPAGMRSSFGSSPSLGRVDLSGTR